MKLSEIIIKNNSPFIIQQSNGFNGSYTIKIRDDYRRNNSEIVSTSNSSLINKTILIKEGNEIQSNV